MVIIDTISDDASQKISVVLDDGTVVVINFNYRPSIQRWTMDVARTDSSVFTAKGLMICIHPNLLREWKNVIPFGIACNSTDGVDPIDVSDFSNQRCSLYVLNASDVESIETDLIGAA